MVGGSTEGGMCAQRFKISVVFAVDLAHFLVADTKNRRSLQELRATGEFSTLLKQHYIGTASGLGAWVSEANRITDHMDTAAAEGGKKVWTHQFVAHYSPLLLLAQENCLRTSERLVPVDAALDPTGESRGGVFRGVTYRLAVDGVITASYDAEFTAEVYAVAEVVKALTTFRLDAFRTFLHFVQDHFGSEARLGPSAKGKRLNFASQHNISRDELNGMTHAHTLVVIEGFIDGADLRSTVDRDRVVESVELVGILNQAPWYRSYARDYCATIKNKQLGRRADDIYITDQRTTVVVSSQYWNPADTIRLYRLYLLRTVEHHVARLALLTQQLSFHREHEELRSLEVKEPFRALPLVLACRANLTLLNESLDFSRLARHGFTRRIAEELRAEMGITEALEAIRNRVADMSAAIDLKSSVTSARVSLARASFNNLLQTVAIVIAVVALLLAVLPS